MRALWGIALLACAGCPSSSDDCMVDSDCGTGNVCARNSECLPASDVGPVRVTWTIRGMPASDTTCAQSPNFEVWFDASSYADTFGFAPVPCDSGLFTVDKLPRRYVSVEIDVGKRTLDAKSFDANGNAAFDLFP